MVGAVPHSVAVPINARMRLFALAGLQTGDASTADGATISALFHRGVQEYGVGPVVNLAGQLILYARKLAECVRPRATAP
jgi:hypothetical protein